MGDERKRLQTLQERGLDFRDARHLFDGRPIFSYPSPREGEDRVVSVGVIERRAGCGRLGGAERDLPHYFHEESKRC